MDFTLTHILTVVVMAGSVSGSHWMNKTDIAVNEANIVNITKQLDRIEKKVDELK